MKNLSYAARASLTRHFLSQQLFLLMEKKKTNLGVAADVTTSKALIDLIHAAGPHICILKTHIDILTDFNQDLISEIKKLAEKYEFLIFEDRKFADIGNTVRLQYSSGIYHIADWADIINAHILPGPGIISGLQQVGLPKNRGLLLLAQMSSEKNLLDKAYTEKAVALAKAHEDFVIGFIAQQKLTEEPQFIHFTPGIQSAATSDNLGQQYLTPERAILENKTDVLLVGRGIYEAANPAQAAQLYQTKGWQAYCELHSL
jgi:orotidine 5'-phosphate decarboxylase subfamily 1